MSTEKTEGTNYGLPIYLNIQASNKSVDEINAIIAHAIEEAAEYESVLYVNIQSGSPPQPPPNPPGGGSGQ